MWSRLLAFSAMVWVFWGCGREPLQTSGCAQANIPDGAIVAAEIRGKQSGADSQGQWIELYNPTTAEISLSGAKIRILRLDGSVIADILVRDPQASIGAKSYFVMGRFPEKDIPSHVDYGYADSFSKDLPGDGILEVQACGKSLDKVVFRGLPTAGTWSLDGALEPNAQNNDNAQSWCVNDTPSTGDGAGLGIPGSPRRKNPPCQKPGS
ncbi:MAG: hypothetical protein GMKNLPBB_02942 [Myxococcota bacterium]|nr:hypothetical protein [Myxococcota bacterium]